MNNLTDLSIEISKIRFSSPLFTASGTAGYGDEFLKFPHPYLGGFVTKGISLKPRKGNPPPRIYETPCGLLNAIGLENVGLDVFIKYVIPKITNNNNIPLIVNIFGETIEELCEISSRLSILTEVSALELNVSCPNVSAGGITFGKDKRLLHSVVRQVKEHTSKPLWVKLTPNVTDIVELAITVEEAGGDAITLANSYTGIAVDCEKEQFRLGNITGGLTGPAIKPLSQYAVWEVSNHVNLPIIASGGCSNATDVLEYLLLGARGVQIGTMALVNPGIFSEVFKEIQEFLTRKRLKRLDQWIGRINEKTVRN